MASDFLPQRRPPAPVAVARAVDIGFAAPRADSRFRRWRTSVARPRHSVLYSRIVHLLRFVLPATALALAALVLLWPQLNPLDGKFRLKPVVVSVEDLENLRMVSPRFVGIDDQKQPYTITATQATQPRGSSDATDLVRPKGDIAINNGAWLALTAEDGVFRKQAQELDLRGGVNLFHDGGYEIATSQATLDLARGAAAGNEPVAGQGPNSELQGEGFRLYDKGARIVVTGRSRVVLYPTPPAKQ
ncbi:MAG: LPS export ABC transporter periplasmic protein LptC [Rhodospirillales bacterium]|nr:LPS export ABC transporter periplasmic protein LptC [Rhodospirillales bacterium]